LVRQKRTFGIIGTGFYRLDAILVAERTASKLLITTGENYPLSLSFIDLSTTDGGTPQSVCCLYIAPISEVVQHFFSVIFLKVVC